MKDPERRGLRRAARTTLTASVTFYIGLYLVDDVQFAVLAVFACIGVNGLADFGGPTRARLIANAALVITGVPLVALGTWVSETTVEATILMFLVAFVVSYMSIYSGYLAAGANVVILFYVVASGIPAEASAIDSRVLGLLFGGAFAVPASVLLWPLHERADFRASLARTVRAVSEAVNGAVGSDAEWERRRNEARAQVTALRPTLATMTLRPAGPTSHDRAEIYIVYALDRMGALLGRLEPCRPQLGDGERTAKLRTLAAALDEAAATLEGTGRGVDLPVLRHTIDEFARRSDERLEDEIAAGTDPAVFGSDADADLALRELGIVVGVVAVNTNIAAGLPVPSTALGTLPGAPALDPTGLPLPTVAWRRARANFTLSSVAMRNALRLAVGLAIARLFVGLFDLQHGFWVVFGTLTVMKSSAGGTRDTVVRAVGGTAIGFAVAAVLLTAFEGDSDLWVVLMPIALFAAMYLATQNLVASQALFTTAIVILFRVLAPASWTLALLRLESVAIGAGIGLLIGILAWPQGAGGQLRSALANLFDTGRRYSALTARMLVAGNADVPNDDVTAARNATIAATHRAEDVFTQYLTEVGPRRVSLTVWGDLLTSGLRLWYTTDTIRTHTDARARATDLCPELIRLLERTTDQLDAGFARTATALRDGTPVSVEAPLPPDASTGPVTSACIQSLRGETDRARLDAAMRLVDMRAWLRVLSDDLIQTSEPVGQVAATLGPARTGEHRFAVSG